MKEAQEYEKKSDSVPNTQSCHENILPFLRRFQSSREYSGTRTSPVLNRLNQVWVTTAAGSIAGYYLVDINLVHRNRYFDITSSDPVEDYLQFEVAQKKWKTSQTMLQGISSGVLPFCVQEGILDYLPTAIEIIKRSFQQIENIETAAEEDPETGEKWVLVSVAVRGGVEEILDQYEHYTEGWISSVPWPQRHKIRLSFNIV